ncbi:hypothetical protein [Streptomyces sp. UG1]|uniref:hypothetical protein n=1 Tax=Streptomyces sp. UG1 TaxID=3417652 RepID=UPI003CF4D62E
MGHSAIGGCHWERNAGALLEGMIIYKWYVDVNGDGSWLVCNTTEKGGYYTEPASAFEFIWRSPRETMCGTGYYGIRNYAGMMDSGEWVGLNATVWSGYHWLPDFSEESMAAAAEDKPVVPTG